MRLLSLEVRIWTEITFDSLGFSKRLIQAGFSQAQAEALATLTAEMEKIRKAEQEKLEAECRNTLATKADIEKVRADIEKVRADTKDAEMRLLKWQIGIGVAIVTIMAKGFGWLGF